MSVVTELEKGLDPGILQLLWTELAEYNPRPSPSRDLDRALLYSGRRNQDNVSEFERVFHHLVDERIVDSPC